MIADKSGRLIKNGAEVVIFDRCETDCIMTEEDNSEMSLSTVLDTLRVWVTGGKYHRALEWLLVASIICVVLVFAWRYWEERIKGRHFVTRRSEGKSYGESSRSKGYSEEKNDKKCSAR